MFDLRYLSRVFLIACFLSAIFVAGYFAPHHTKPQIRVHTVYIQPKAMVVDIKCPRGDIHTLTIKSTSAPGQVVCHTKRDDHG